MTALIWSLKSTGKTTTLRGIARKRTVLTCTVSGGILLTRMRFLSAAHCPMNPCPNKSCCGYPPSGALP